MPPKESRTTPEISRTIDRRRIRLLALALAASWASMLLHNQWELPLTPLDLENTGPLLIDVALLIVCWRRPSSPLAWTMVLGWALLNMVIGGLVTVLPLPVLPFAPEQTIDHYAVHLVYAVGQVPLVLVASAALRQLPSRRHGNGERGGRDG
jgi:hypothetical protein